MKKLNIVFLMFFSIYFSLLPIAFSGAPSDITFQISQSNELADVVSTFAPPAESESATWIGLRDLQNFTNFYTTDTPNKNSNALISGYMGILFNGKGFEDYQQKVVNGTFRETRTEVGYTTELVFYGPFWNGYDHLNININVPPNRISYILTGTSAGSFEDNLFYYFKAHKTDISFLEQYTNARYSRKYLYKIVAPNKAPIYMVLESWSGSGGLLGQVNIDLYLKSDAASEHLKRAN